MVLTAFEKRTKAMFALMLQVEVRSVVLEEQVVDTVLQKAKVTDKAVSYEEAVKPAEAAQAD